MDEIQIDKQKQIISNNVNVNVELDKDSYELYDRNIRTWGKLCQTK